MYSELCCAKICFEFEDCMRKRAWAAVIWRCWQDHKPYDEPTYEAALRKSQSPLVRLFDRVELGKSPWKNPAKKN